VPKSVDLTLLSCEMDVLVRGGYRLVFAGNPEPMAFFGKYLEVTSHSRLSWSNDESPDGAITTVTFEERGGKTRVVVQTSIPRRKRSTPPSPPKLQVDLPSSSSNSTSFL
jgi:uncharacterized protein YndB with AHSA1/START domain